MFRSTDARLLDGSGCHAERLGWQTSQRDWRSDNGCVARRSVSLISYRERHRRRTPWPKTLGVSQFVKAARPHGFPLRWFPKLARTICTVTGYRRYRHCQMAFESGWVKRNICLVAASDRRSGLSARATEGASAFTGSTPPRRVPGHRWQNNRPVSANDRQRLPAMTYSSVIPCVEVGPQAANNVTGEFLFAQNEN